MAKYFNFPESQDFPINDENGKVGELRVRPSGILWKPKNAKQYYRVSIEEFADYAEELNVKVKQ